MKKRLGAGFPAGLEETWSARDSHHRLHTPLLTFSQSRPATTAELLLQGAESVSLIWFPQSLQDSRNFCFKKQAQERCSNLPKGTQQVSSTPEVCLTPKPTSGSD